MVNNIDAGRLLRLEAIVENLVAARNVSQKLEVLQKTSEFQENFERSSPLGAIYAGESPENQLSMAAIFTIGEAGIVFRTAGSAEFDKEKFQRLLLRLLEVEVFYDKIGGIVGYHFHVLNLLYGLRENQETGASLAPSEYVKPVGYDLSEEGPLLNGYVRWGIESLPFFAEIYPVGGAGDRLNLRDEETGEPLPAASLDFCGRTLLASLIRDIQAREYLYYKLKGKQVQTPIAMMTSEEKENHKRVVSICSENHWFGRPKESICLFSQPLVPVITVDGHWSMSGPLELCLKPGGHGAIWKLAKDKGVFEWLQTKGRTKALIRQINNPVAGTDALLLAFAGIGAKMGKTFGFASCPRLLNTAQGTIVLLKKEEQGGFEYAISNIEYTDFSKRGLEDLPEKPGSPFSKFPANTNILFADLNGVEEAIPSCPVPGMLINFKSAAPYIDSQGNESQVKAGRLESTMQNLSDCLVDYADHPLTEKELLDLKSYVAFNERRKTISVTKKSYGGSGSLLETPPGCFFEILQNNHELLSARCGMSLPDLCDESSYLENGPNCLFLYHPALGPLYSVISQKIRGGRMGQNSELQLEIAEVELEDLELEGSLVIEAQEPLGKRDETGFLFYGEEGGKCELKNVTIRNLGISREADNLYWKNRIERKEGMRIVLKGNAEFFAENITFLGNHLIEVPHGFRWIARQEGGKVSYQKEMISQGSWCWEYAFNEDSSIQLAKKRVSAKGSDGND